MIFALLFLLSLIIGTLIYIINKKFNFFGSFGKFMLGMGFAIVLAIAFFILILLLAGLTNARGNDILWFGIIFIGASQLIYIIPIILLLIKNKQYDMMKGVITGAILIALLNGGCFAFLLPNMKIGG